MAFQQGLYALALQFEQRIGTMAQPTQVNFPGNPGAGPNGDGKRTAWRAFVCYKHLHRRREVFETSLHSKTGE
jgi:hypothetical protein